MNAHFSNAVNAVAFTWGTEKVYHAAQFGEAVQLSNTYGVGGQGVPGGTFSPYIDDVQDAPDWADRIRQHPAFQELLQEYEGDEEAAMDELMNYAAGEGHGGEVPGIHDPRYLEHLKVWGRMPSPYLLNHLPKDHDPAAQYERLIHKPPPSRHEVRLSRNA